VLDQVTDYFLIGYLGLIGLALIGRGVRALNERRHGMITLSYGNGRTVRVPRGLSVLEASLRNNVPHASVCGGRARCSTCRIRVIGDCDSLPEPSKREAFVLNRVGAGADPAIRLACQLRPDTDLSFFQIFLPQITAATLRTSSPTRIGEERYLVSMFVDMRGSTKLAEKRLPFDTVFIVNRFLGAVSQAVIECGGQPNQFVGDGQLALFGLGTNPQTACRQALKAAAQIATNVDELNQFLKHDLREPIRFGIGIHGGEVIIGDIGYRDHMVFTALGDAVNVAARLQDMTKSLSCEVIVSEEVRKTAGLPADALPPHDVDIRGRAEPMIVRAVTSAKSCRRWLKIPRSPRRNGLTVILRSCEFLASLRANGSRERAPDDSEAIQSHKRRLDCFVASAPRNDDHRHPEEPHACAASRRMAAGACGPSFEARKCSHLGMRSVGDLNHT